MDGSSKEEEDSTFTNISLADDIDHSQRILYPRPNILLSKMMNADMDDLSARVDAVKEENLKLKSENQVLGQYIENLMSASSVFQTTDTKSKRK
ncbi:short coiled-coil protein isoform X2 [Nycticebus coucang]|uniref:short coiled-coil protein isoform X2 n=1 Tax=Nycticebus coucang TaxID=9470 RepID=UPI00234E276A|nr:short coiled-coil protein isoform X2 [Nycticebus coucang]XP_053437921.1 short coiled-coil protein isoform X2 [Nycticebus coucang]